MSEQDDQNQIEEVFSRLNKAHADKDAAAIVACHSADAVMFDLAPPLRSRGLKQSEIQKWLDGWDGPITMEGTQIELSIGSDVAFASALMRMRGSQGGKSTDLWFRVTQCLRKRDGGWLIVHHHASVPFYMDDSARAALDLKP